MVDISLNFAPSSYNFLLIPKILLCLQLLIVYLLYFIFNFIEWSLALSKFRIHIVVLTNFQYASFTFIFQVSYSWHSCNLIETIDRKMHFIRRYPLRIKVYAYYLIVVRMWIRVHDIFIMSVVGNSHSIH
jgi:hypothetical protein